MNDDHEIHGPALEVVATAPESSAPPRRRKGSFVVWLASMLGLLGAVGAFAFLIVATDPATGFLGAGRSPRPTLGPSSSPALISMAPGQIGMPEDADCGACHVSDGGIVGVRSIPTIAHPIHGWTECTSCHDNARLVATAPGHTGIHADECIVCHQSSSEPAPTPRHPTLPDSDCLACHGRIAPLPSSMIDRPRNLCWLCHHS